MVSSAWDWDYTVTYGNGTTRQITVSDGVFNKDLPQTSICLAGHVSGDEGDPGACKQQ